MPDDEEYGKPVPKTWEEAVKEAGSEEKASLAYPTLDPRYQADVKKYGEAKGIEKYSHEVVNPETIGDKPDLIQQIGENLPGSVGYADALRELKSEGGLGGDLADVGEAMLGTTNAFSQATVGHGLPADEGGSAPAAPAAPAKKPAASSSSGTTVSPAAQAADQMMQALAGEYTGEMMAVAPYMSGQAGEQAAAGAQKLGRVHRRARGPGSEPDLRRGARRPPAAGGQRRARRLGRHRPGNSGSRQGRRGVHGDRALPGAPLGAAERGAVQDRDRRGHAQRLRHAQVGPGRVRGRARLRAGRGELGHHTDLPEPAGGPAGGADLAVDG